MAVIIPPDGPFSSGLDYTFTSITDVLTPVYSWTPGPGVTVISQPSPGTVVVRFASAGVATLNLTVTGDGAAVASWYDTVLAYTPQLDFSDVRNSMYAGCLN